MYCCNVVHQEEYAEWIDTLKYRGRPFPAVIAQQVFRKTRQIELKFSTVKESDGIQYQTIMKSQRNVIRKLAWNEEDL